MAGATATYPDMIWKWKYPANTKEACKQNNVNTEKKENIFSRPGLDGKILRRSISRKPIIKSAEIKFELLIVNRREPGSYWLSFQENWI